MSLQLVNVLLAESGDAEMRLYRVLVFLLPGLVFLAGCGEDAEIPEDPVDQIENGDIHGTITDMESGALLEGASVSIGDQVALTGTDGKYALKGISLSDKIEVSVASDGYRDNRTTISLDRELILLNISLAPVDSSSDQILGVLAGLSQDIEALDPDRTPSIQSCFSEDYIAANDPVKDQATFIVILAGIVSPDYEGIPDSVLTIVDMYSKLDLNFVNPDVELDKDTASVLMRLEIYTETRPDPPNPAKKWEIVVDGRIDFRKEDDDWKIIYWRVMPDFLKFEEKPLE